MSLLPAALARDLGLRTELRSRSIASYSPLDDTGLLIALDRERTSESLRALTGDPGIVDAWEGFQAMLLRVAERVFPTMTEPLRSRHEMRRLIDDDEAWAALFEEPLAAVLERTFGSDLVRGLVCTDATIGTFAPAGDPALRQNRCFLYHVIGNGTGRWDIPVGGMGALTDQLIAFAPERRRGDPHRDPGRGHRHRRHGGRGHLWRRPAHPGPARAGGCGSLGPWRASWARTRPRTPLRVHS